MFKEFLYYQRISIKEGLDIESGKPNLKRYDKAKSRKCRLCSEIFIIKKNFKDNDNDCNQCFKIRNDITKTGRMYVIWKENIKYGVYTNFYQTDANNIVKKKKILKNMELLTSTNTLKV